MKCKNRTMNIMSSQLSWKDVLPGPQIKRRIEFRTSEEKAKVTALAALEVKDVLKKHGPMKFAELFKLVDYKQLDIEAGLRALNAFKIRIPGFGMLVVLPEHTDAEIQRITCRFKLIKSTKDRAKRPAYARAKPEVMHELVQTDAPPPPAIVQLTDQHLEAIRQYLTPDQKTVDEIIEYTNLHEVSVYRALMKLNARCSNGESMRWCGFVPNPPEFTGSLSDLFRSYSYYLPHPLNIS